MRGDELYVSVYQEGLGGDDGHGSYGDSGGGGGGWGSGVGGGGGDGADGWHFSSEPRAPVEEFQGHVIDVQAEQARASVMCESQWGCVMLVPTGERAPLTPRSCSERTHHNVSVIPG